jgi:hypothetical protein
MRNFNNFNHWLAEVRDIARKAKVRNEESDKPMSDAQLRLAFNKTTMDCYYSTMASPQEAFNEEMDRWAES